MELAQAWLDDCVLVSRVCRKLVPTVTCDRTLRTQDLDTHCNFCRVLLIKQVTEALSLKTRGKKHYSWWESLFSPGWPWTCNPPASGSGVLLLKVLTTVLNLYCSCFGQLPSGWLNSMPKETFVGRTQEVPIEPESMAICGLCHLQRKLVILSHADKNRKSVAWHVCDGDRTVSGGCWSLF